MQMDKGVDGAIAREPQTLQLTLRYVLDDGRCKWRMYHELALIVSI